jgi:ribosomal protein S18 acetylase RimI-like enzyme
MTAMAEVGGRTVRKLTEADWAALRATRLAALADAPYAFASTLERELAFTEETWRGRLAPANIAAHFGADDAAAASNGAAAPLAGLAALLREPDAARPERWQLVSMWVNPRARGQGLADRLITAVCEQARAEGAAEIGLWVTLRNDRARAFYRRCGFQATGEQALVRPEEPSLWEERMVRSLSAGSDGRGAANRSGS